MTGVENTEGGDRLIKVIKRVVKVNIHPSSTSKTKDVLQRRETNTPPLSACSISAISS